MSQSEINTYLTEIARYPVLSKEAQLLHCKRIHAWVTHEGGREAAPPHIARAGSRSLQTMTRTNLRLVVSVAKTYLGRGLEFSDLIQEGSLGLIRGLELYDPTRGYAVSTYVYWWIRQAITRAIYTHSRPIRIPINTHELVVRIQRCINETLSSTGKAPSIPEISERTRLSQSRVSQILDTHVNTVCLSLDAICAEGSNPIVEILPAPTENSGTPESFALLTEDQDLIRGAFCVLNPTEAQIVNATFFEERSLVDVARDLGVSRSRASQIQRVGLNKLRDFLHLQGHDR